MVFTNTVYLFVCLLLLPLTKGISQNHKVAIFSGGCFWCIQAAYQSMDGVIDARSGFSGGTLKNPTYKQVRSGSTDQLQAIQVLYDPSKISYKELVDMFWTNIDPTDPGGQYQDRGPQYRTALYYNNEEQRQIAINSKQKLENSGIYQQDIVTMILPATPFYPAEQYHQNYYNKNDIKYQTCRQPSPSPKTHVQIPKQQTQL